MGRHSDSDDEKKRKKKSKRRSRSRSSSIDSRTSKSSKHKKSKKSKHKRRSRSRSPERSYRSKRRSRSTSRERRRSRSRSRSKPKSYRTRSRSPSPYRSRRRSRSRSRSRRSLSRGKSRRSRTRSPRRSRSPRRRSRSRSRDRSRRDRSFSREKERKDWSPLVPRVEPKPDNKEDPCANIPGFDQMTPSEQAEARLQMALKAAAAAGEKLKEQGVLPASLGTSVKEQQQRVRAIENIESESFTPSAFKSSRGQSSAPTLESSHDEAMFGLGDLTLNITASSELRAKDTESLMHPNLYISSEDKMANWVKKLTAMRKKKLEGSLIH